MIMMTMPTMTMSSFMAKARTPETADMDALTKLHEWDQHID